MQFRLLRILSVSLLTFILACCLSGCQGIGGAMMRGNLATQIVTVQPIAPTLQQDRVGAQLLVALQEYPTFFEKFRGSPCPDEMWVVLINELKRRETARQAGTYKQEIDKIVADYRAKGWFNDLRAEAYKKKMLQPFMMSYDNRAVIASLEKGRAKGTAGKGRTIVGLPDAPPKLRPYRIGYIEKTEKPNPMNPAVHTLDASIQFALPIPKGTRGADHVQRLFATAFTQLNGWTTSEGHAMLANNYGNAPEALMVIFESLYDDFGFIWVTVVYTRPK